MRSFFSLLGLFLFTFGCESETGVTFSSESLDHVLDLATKAEKLVLVDIYSDN
jgi:hypothetical protein